MDTFKCSFCGASEPIPIAKRAGTFSYSNVSERNNGRGNESTIILAFYRCYSCDKDTIIAEIRSKDNEVYETPLYPKCICMHFPNYVPESIHSDYMEACAITSLSPKAAATLARRCLQGIIRDFWKVKPGRLVDEINQLKDKIQPDLWSVIDGVRKIGNIGAHMEKDVNTIVDIDPDEAERLKKLIELLIKEWYIARQQRQELFSSIIELDSNTQAQRKAAE